MAGTHAPGLDHRSRWSLRPRTTASTTAAETTDVETNGLTSAGEHQMSSLNGHGSMSGGGHYDIPLPPKTNGFGNGTNGGHVPPATGGYFTGSGAGVGGHRGGPPYLDGPSRDSPTLP
jgi:hypothetical protein